MAGESFSQRSLIRAYFKAFPDIHNPETLTGHLEGPAIRDLTEYYIAYRVRKAWAEKVEHVKHDTLVSSFSYTYDKNALTKIIWLKYTDQVSDRCEITFPEGSRLTQCFYKSGALYTEEWYNPETAEYSFARYGASGKMEYSEHGSYSPPKDH